MYFQGNEDHTHKNIFIPRARRPKTQISFDYIYFMLLVIVLQSQFYSWVWALTSPEHDIDAVSSTEVLSTD